MRDLVLFGVFFCLLPLAFKRPWIGVLIFAWVSYMNPHRFTWGAAYDFPFAKVAALVTLVCLFFTRDRMKIPWTREAKLLFALGLYFTGTTFYAFFPDKAWPEWQNVAKIFLMTFVTIVLINDREKYRWLLLIIVLSIGFLGFKGGLFSLATGGEHRVFGPAGSFFIDNNDMALALNMTLPFIYYLYREEKKVFLKYALLGMFVMSIVAVIFTYSRGGFLTLAGVGALLLVRSKHKALAGFVAAVAIMFGMSMIPDKWFDRIDSIKTYGEDASAMGRINAWNTAMNFAKARPFSGGGFKAFQPESFEIYSPQPDNYHDVHSIYFEVLGEHGFIAFGLFIALIVSTFMTTRKLHRLAAAHNVEWGWNYANMLQISLAAYMIGGVFLGRAYFDLFYHIVALVVILNVLVVRAVKEEQACTNETGNCLT